MRIRNPSNGPGLVVVGVLALLVAGIWALVAAVDVYGVTLRFRNVPRPVLRLFHQG